MKYLILLLALGYAQCVFAQKNQADSLPKTSKKVYKVKTGDTMFGIAQKFNTQIKEIARLNMLKETDQLTEGRYLYLNVPNQYAKNSELLNAIPTKKEARYKYHEVKEGDALLKIANQYKVPIDSLKKWNKLESDILRKHSSIIVGHAAKIEHTEDNKEPYIPLTGKNLVQEVGMGEKIAGTDSKMKLALHRKAAVGTFIRVKNPSSGASVTVRVIGNIPNVAGDENVIIKLSQAACNTLGVVNERFPVNLSYEKRK